MNAATTPRVHIVSSVSIGYQPRTGCGVREPERDRGTITYVCPQNGNKTAAHTDNDTQHGPMCERHAREQIATCLAKTCVELRWNGAAYVVEPTYR